VRFLQQIVRRDFYEYNALPYSRYQMKALFALHDYAPDASVRTTAKGVLDWVFAKQAVGSNLDRDQRPYRRRPESSIYANSKWWGKPATSSTVQAALLAGPLDHAHEDIDLQLNDGKDEDGDEPLTKILQNPDHGFKYPYIGTVDDWNLAAFTDVADTTYRLPAALGSWLAKRFTDDEANRVTYVQFIRHTSLVKDDPALFPQPNAGVELYSGNRNWTILAGGVPVAPGDPGPPPQTVVTLGGINFPIIDAYAAAGAGGGIALGATIGAVLGGPVTAGVGGLIGGILGGVTGAIAPGKIAANKQHAKLWEDQAGVMRETMLLPTPVALNRAQTIRFGWPVVTKEGGAEQARLCVAEGFACGFDLIMPTRPFPHSDAARCPMKEDLPTALSSVLSITDADGLQLRDMLGCLLSPGHDRNFDWSTWQYERGSLVMALSDPAGQERIGALWVEKDKQSRQPVRMRFKFRTPGHPHDWFNIYVYDFQAEPEKNRAPVGYVRYANTGDPGDTGTSEEGETSFPLDDGVESLNWSVLVEGCDPTYFKIFGLKLIRTGHKCKTDILPRLWVNVAPEPKQPFSCRAEQIQASPGEVEDLPQEMGGKGIVMEIGSCLPSSVYGLFVYKWERSCDQMCPAEASNFGFVVAAPSRGWSFEDFKAAIEKSLKNGSHHYAPLEAHPIVVPISPSVIKNDGSWTAIGPPSSHTVTFQWGARGQFILDDTGAPGFYSTDMSSVTANAHVSTPDAVVNGGLIRNLGFGCFTVSGLPTPTTPDPPGLVVDLRNLTAPKVDETRNTSALTSACN
jgi:hypothetical protein